MGLGQIDGSNPNTSKGQPVRLVQGVFAWRRIFGPAAADGAAVVDPYAITGFATKSKEAHEAGGRMLINRNGGGRLEVLPLLSSAGATMKYQLWGFDWNDNVPAGSASDQFAPLGNDNDGKMGNVISVPYPLMLDIDYTQTEIGAMVPIVSSTLKVFLSYKNNCEPYYDPDATEYFACPRQVFDLASFYGIFPYVTSVSTGTGILLARVV